ncbi:MAG: hypothetical protein NTZ49_01120 [Candidatus Parcubacteria bacterium]|nr:hypothetical protein [Candidatus Parcubacteria bacterium]
MLTNPNDKKDIIRVQPKPVENVKKAAATSVGGLKIGNVQTLNLIVEPLKKRYETHYKKDKMHLIVDLVLGAIILILLGVMVNLWIFSRSRINLMDFKVSSSPENLVNGQETEFTIDYTNTSKDELHNVTLIFKTPTGLNNPQYSTLDFDLKNNTLKIGDLAENAHGQFKVKGLLLGNYNDKQEFIAAITYQNKYGQTSQEFFNQQFALTDSVIKTELKVPERVISNGIFTANLNLNNISTFNLETVKIKIDGPANFNLRQVKLDKVGANTYLIGKLAAGQNFSQDFSAKILGSKETSATVSTEIIATYNNEEFVLYKIDNTITTSISNLKLGFLNLDANRNIAPGGTTTYTLYYKNNEDYTLQNVELGLALSGDYADTSYLAKSYKASQGNTVFFGQKDYPELAKVEPGKEGQIQIKVAAKSNIVFLQFLETGYKLEATVLANYDDPELKTRVTLEGEPIYTNVDSDLNLKTTAMFYTSQGDQIGVGNIPPIVGEYTSYWAIIKINNTNNKIKDLKVTAKVPAGIEFTNIYNVTDGEQIKYNEATGQIEWNVANVNAFAGIFSASPEARIQLAITPTENQIGKSPLLLTDIKALATDAVTGSFLSASGQNISIAIFDDPSLNKVTP